MVMGDQPEAASSLTLQHAEAATKAATARTRVALYGLSGDGDQFDLDVEPPFTVASLKERVRELWQIPPVCQMIVADARTLGDSEEISDCCAADGEAVPLTMLISVDTLLCDLESRHASSAQKAAALRDLAQLGVRGGERALTSAARHLHDQCAEVRTAALWVLRAVAARGRADAIQAALLALSDASYTVRAEALRVLSEVAERGDSRAMDAAADLLRHEGPDFMISAMEALKTVAETGEVGGIADVIARFEKKCSYEGTALEALGILTEKGSTRAGAKVVTLLLCSMSSRAQGMALERLVTLMNNGDVGAAMSVIACLDRDRGLGRAAMDALSKVKRGDERIVATVADCLATSDWGEWPLVVEALSMVTEEGDERAMAAVAPHFEAEHWWVRRAAILALCALLNRGNARARVRAYAALIPRMEDENGLVRQAALKAFAALNR